MTIAVTSRAVVLLSALLGLAGYIWVYAAGLADLPIRSDGFSYYVYLPSWFLFHDTTLSAIARDCCGGEFPDFSAIVRWPGTRRWVSAHPIGVAVMQAPVFPVAHALTRWTNLSPDGFSLYYQHAAGLAGLAWLIAGLEMLRRLLLRSFSDGVTAATIAAILLGTNLYHYGTFDSSYSHAYSFSLFGALMYLTAVWHERPDARTSALIGLVSGLIVLVRHTNVLFLIMFALYGAGTRGGLTASISRLFNARRELLRIAAVGAVVVAPQLLIYYEATGHFVISSYVGMAFNWTSPKLFGVLFGVQKGLFFWSPLLMLAVVGLVILWRSGNRSSAFVVPGVIFLAINTYLIASWWDWQFGASYGHRGFADALPVFALGLAALFERASRTVPARTSVAIVVTALVLLSAFQMLQYWYGIVPFSDTTWRQYRGIFLQWR